MLVTRFFGLDKVWGVMSDATSAAAERITDLFQAGSRSSTRTGNELDYIQ